MPRSEDLDALQEIAAEQGGYFTAAQAARFGVPQTNLARLAGSEDVRRVRRGVYAMRHARNRLEDEIGAWLSVDRKRLPWERRDDPVAVVSHASAAGVHGLGTLIPRQPALTAAPEHRSATRASGIEFHVAPLAREDWEWVDAEGTRLPVTTPARTIVDTILSGEEPSYVIRAIAEALDLDTMTPADLVAAARRRKTKTATLTQRIDDLLRQAA
jgi:predicted transcriptional regulator of viral defense system